MFFRSFAAVLQIKDAIPVNFSTLNRLLGEEANIVSRAPVFINRFVRAEFLQVTNAAPFQDEGGRLFLYPIEEGQYNLHLLYLLDNDISRTEICWLQFLPEFFDMFDEEALTKNVPFRFDQTTEQQFNICHQARG